MPRRSTRMACAGRAPDAALIARSGSPTAAASAVVAPAGGNGDVRELHWPRNDVPDLRASQGVTGYARGPDGLYIHIADGAARVVFERDTENGLRGGAQPHGPGGTPYIAQANGFVRNFHRTADGMSFEFGGYYQPFVELADAQRCRVRIAGRPIDARRDGTVLRFEAAADVRQPMRYQSVEIACDR